MENDIYLYVYIYLEYIYVYMYLEYIYLIERCMFIDDWPLVYIVKGFFW